MVVDESGKPVAIGRLYINADNEASIRFLAVDPTVQVKGLGTLVAMTLESVARQEGVKRVVCSAREDAVEFLPNWVLKIRGRLPRRKLRRCVIS